MLQAARKTDISEFGIPPEEHQVYINLRELRTSELSLTEVHFAKWFCDT
ncbi:MAG TPA: hypothetical protein PKJ14_02970 [Candidatus Cloacimonadota bacterium]|nr:hypothetical protein [Candidatus Cloacimonadota bacterium]HQL15143.1 hypothetical protein [Candidatus Cloacimonadota bacterium]